MNLVEADARRASTDGEARARLRRPARPRSPSTAPSRGLAKGQGDLRHPAARLQPRRRRLGAYDLRRGRELIEPMGAETLIHAAHRRRSTCASSSRARVRVAVGRDVAPRLRTRASPHLRRQRKGGALMSREPAGRACRPAPPRPYRGHDHRPLHPRAGADLPAVHAADLLDRLRPRRVRRRSSSTSCPSPSRASLCAA